MPLTLIKEDGTGKVDANSYASLTEANDYHDGHLYASAWTAATTPNKEKALAMATRLIDSGYHFHGSRGKAAQALKWPRVGCPDPDRNPDDNGGEVPTNEVPRAVVQATCEFARELLIADRTGAPVGEGIYLRRETDNSQTIYSRRDRRPVIPQTVQTMLNRFGVMVGSGASGVRLSRA